MCTYYEWEENDGKENMCIHCIHMYVLYTIASGHRHAANTFQRNEKERSFQRTEFNAHGGRMCHVFFSFEFRRTGFESLHFFPHFCILLFSVAHNRLHYFRNSQRSFGSSNMFIVFFFSSFLSVAISYLNWPVNWHCKLVLRAAN